MEKEQKRKTMRDLISFRNNVAGHMEGLEQDEKDSEVDWKTAYRDLNSEAFEFSNRLVNSLHLDKHEQYNSTLDSRPIEWKVLKIKK